MGLTFVAAGVSVPDALSSLAVVKEGKTINHSPKSYTYKQDNVMGLIFKDTGVSVPDALSSLQIDPTVEAGRIWSFGS